MIDDLIMAAMTTSAPQRERVGDTVRLSVDVSGRDPLWFAVDAELADLLSDRADHVLIGLLMPAMKEGRDLHIGGTVTDVLLHNANSDLQRLLRMKHPDLTSIRVSADIAAPPAPRAAGIATGFSGGVDSFSTITEYFWSADAPPSLRITHLLNNNVGAHGHDGSALWRTRCAPLRAIAESLDLPFVMVDSNLDAHYPRIGFIESVTMRNATVPHLLGGGVGHLHLASAVPFTDARVDSTRELARVDTMLVPMLSSSAVTISSANSGLTRVEKTISVVDRPEAKHLDVCTNDDPQRVRNCSQCSKCLRTMLTLEIAGRLRDFCPATFSYETYAAHREKFVAGVLAVDTPYNLDIRAYAARTGFRWTASQKRRATVLRVRNEASNAAHRLARTPIGRSLRRFVRTR